MDKPKVIFENKDFAVIAKPPGWVVHAAAARAGKRPQKQAAQTPAPPLLTEWLLRKYPEIKTVGDEPVLRPGIVHRLDKDTSGLMLVPRNQKTFEYLKSLFQNHEIKKTYLAVVFGKPKKQEGVVDAPIGIRNGTTKRSTRSPKMAKAAVTKYKVIKTFTAPGADGKPAEFSLLEVRPETGRTHQIRVHLASIGYPIVGDPIYGRKKQPAWAARLMLHALAVEFKKDDGRRVKFEAPPEKGFVTI